MYARRAKPPKSLGNKNLNAPAMALAGLGIVVYLVWTEFSPLV
jgi:hypothetical protein